MSTEGRIDPRGTAVPDGLQMGDPRTPGAGDGAPATPAAEEPTYMLVMPPRRVQVVKELVEGVRHKAPWLFACIAPIKPLFSGLYYGWINRHERVPVPPPGASTASAPPPSASTGSAPTSPRTHAGGPTPVGHVEVGVGPASALSANAGTALDDPADVAAPAVAARAAAMEVEVAPERCAGPSLGHPQGLDGGDPARGDHVAVDAPGDGGAGSGAAKAAQASAAATTNGAHLEQEARSLPVAASDAPEPAPREAGDGGPQGPMPTCSDGAPRPHRPSEVPVSDGGAGVAVAPRVRRAPPERSPAERLEEHLERARRLSERRAKWAGRAERVSMVIGTLGPGGAERQLVTLATELRRRGRGQCRAITIREPVGNDGHHVESLAANARLERTTPMDIGAAYECLEREGLGFLREVLAPELFWDIPPLLRAFRASQPSVVHAWLDWSSLVAGFAAILLPVRRVVLSTRNVAPRNFPSLDRPYLRDMYRLLLRDPRVRIINNSSAGADDYAAWLGIRRSQIRVVRNGVDMGTIRDPGPRAIEALRAEMGLDRGMRLVAGVFRLAEEKQPETFVEVAERILAAEPSTVVAHAGSGEMEARMRTLVAASPHAARFRLLGRRHDVPTILSAADLCLLTSRKEGTPNVLIEAQVLGCPVVATRAGGAPETFEHQRTGFLCEVGDAEGIAAAALRLLRDEPLRRSMAESARAFASGRFSVRRMADETIELYD